MAARVFLGLMGLMWAAYGVWCFINPGFLQESVGVAAIAGTPGLVDIQATYGGFQTAVGVLLLAGALRPENTRSVVVTYGVLCAGIGSARLVAALLASEWSSYTSIGVGFELGTVAVVLALLARMRSSA
jgi:CHASE2 domain-containing sensor protein